MPELPEVETVVRQLAPALRRKKILAMEFYDPKLGTAPTELVVGRTIERTFRLGKQVVLELGGQRSPPVWIAVHLRMTGRLIWRLTTRLTNRQHLRARLRVRGGCLLFYDPRRFGTIILAPELAALEPRGLDPLAPAFTPAVLGRLLHGSRQPLKPWLLRQDKLVGLGNIYACEALFAARIDPTREAGALTPAEIRRLQRAVRQVLKSAIQHCGTTFSDFLNAHGVSGSYQHFLGVYGREGQPCRRCGETVLRMTQQQRSTFFCHSCQPSLR